MNSAVIQPVIMSDLMPERAFDYHDIIFDIDDVKCYTVSMNTNHQVTLRNVDDGLKRLIDQNAKKRGKSINQYMLDIVAAAVGYSEQPQRDWREFAGAIPDDGINAEALADFESIDETMWK